MIPTGSIDPQPHDLQRFDDEDPRLDDLIATLKAHGQLQAIVVRQAGDRFALIIGSRRWRAARALGWPEIRADVLPEDTTDTSALTLVENLARRQLSPVEEAIGVAQMLKEHDNDPTPVARKLGRSVRWIEQRAQLVTLPPPLLHALHAGTIRIAHAEALARITDQQALERLLATVIEQTPPAHLVARWATDAIESPTVGALTPDPADPDAGGGPQPAPGALCACCQRVVPIRTSTAISVCLVCAEEIRTAATQPPVPLSPEPVRLPPNSDTPFQTPPLYSDTAG